MEHEREYNMARFYARKSYIKNESDVEDAAMNGVYRAVLADRKQPGNGAYQRTAIKNAIFDYSNHLERAKRLNLTSFTGQDILIEDESSVHNADLRMIARNAIALMTEKEKETVLQSFLCGSPVEAARVMGEPWPTVKIRLGTMRHRLKVLMKGEVCQ